MKFGIFYELQLPKPWGEGDEHALVQDALAQVELADRLGLDYAWAVEHHFLEEYSHCSASDVFLAASALGFSHAADAGTTVTIAGQPMFSLSTQGSLFSRPLICRRQLQISIGVLS
jgi:hypothetical protein